MKIVNRTADERTLMRPSRARAILGWVLLGVSGALFVALTLGPGDALAWGGLMLACFGFGIFLLFTNSVESLDLDKRNRRIVRVRAGLFGRITERYDWGAVARVRVERDNAGRACGSFLVLTNGERIRLDTAREGRTQAISDEPRGETLAEEVARFLGVPLEEERR